MQQGNLLMYPSLFGPPPIYKLGAENRMLQLNI